MLVLSVFSSFRFWWSTYFHSFVCNHWSVLWQEEREGHGLQYNREWAWDCGPCSHNYSTAVSLQLLWCNVDNGSYYVEQLYQWSVVQTLASVHKKQEEKDTSGECRFGNWNVRSEADSFTKATQKICHSWEHHLPNLWLTGAFQVIFLLQFWLSKAMVFSSSVFLWKT